MIVQRMNGISLVFSAIDVSATTCNSPRMVPGLLHHTDVVASSSWVTMVTPCCNAVVDVFTPIHCWAGGPPLADVGHSSPNRCDRCGDEALGGVTVVGMSVVGG